MGGDVTVSFHHCWLQELSVTMNGKASCLSSAEGWRVGIQLQVSHLPIIMSIFRKEGKVLIMPLCKPKSEWRP